MAGDGEDPVLVVPRDNGDQVGFDWLQPGRRILLDDIKQVRDQRLAGSFGFGRVELEIPVLDLHFLKKANPDLDSKDGQIKTQAWKKFLAGPESQPYRTRGRGRFMARSAGGIDHGGQGSGSE